MQNLTILIVASFRFALTSSILTVVIFQTFPLQAVAGNISEDPACAERLLNWPSPEEPFLQNGRLYTLSMSHMALAHSTGPFYFAVVMDPMKDLSQYSLLAYVNQDKLHFEDKLKVELGFHLYTRRNQDYKLAKWQVSGILVERPDHSFVFRVEHNQSTKRSPLGDNGEPTETGVQTLEGMQAEPDDQGVSGNIINLAEEIARRRSR